MLNRNWFLPSLLLITTSTVSAQNWQIVSGAPTNATSLGAASGNTLYAGFGQNQGVYRSTDNGVNWSAVNSGLLDGSSAAISPTALFRASNGRIFRGGPSSSWNNGVASPVFYSDNGSSWTQAPYPFVTPTTNPGGAAVSDFEQIGNDLFFSDVLSHGVWKSTDNGVTWEKADNGLQYAPFTGYKFARALAKSGTTLLTVDPYYGPFRSTDGGTYWQATHQGILGTPGGVLGGVFYPSEDIVATTDGTVYSSSSIGIYKSTDAGQIWTPVSFGVFSGGGFRKLATLGNSIYVAYAIGGGIRIYESTDGGIGWQVMPTNGLTLTGLDVLATTFLGQNNALYLAGPEGLFRLDTTSAVRTPLPPVFVTSTGDRGVNLNESITLNAQYGGTTPMTFQWFLNGTLIPSATSSSYTISPATTNNAGLYSVVVTNVAGAATNNVGTLAVSSRSIGSPDYSYANGTGQIDLYNWNGFFILAAQVTSMARQSDGKAIVGGTFAYAGRGVAPGDQNGLQRSGIVRVNQDGTADASFSAGTGPNVAPDAITLQPDGKILVSGEFTTWNGIAANRLVRLNSDGSLDRTFNIGNGPNARVYRVVVMPDGKIAICGTFTMFNGRYRGYLAMLNPDGSLAPGLGEIYGVNTFVFAMALQADGKLLVVGDFATAESQPRNRVARFNPDGTLDASFNPGTGPNGRVVHVRELPDGRIFIGGAFGSVSGSTRNRMAILSSNGAVDPSFAPANYSRDVYSSTDLGTDQIAVGGDNGLLVLLDKNTGALVQGGVSGALTTYGLAEEPDGRFLRAAGSTAFGNVGSLSRLFGASEHFGINTQPVPVAANAGANATFSVGVRSSTPVTYQWLKNGSVLNGKTASALTLNAVSAGDVASYSVIVSNSGVVVTSSTAGLTILGAPVIVSQSIEKTISAGYTNGIAVEAIGQGSLTYEWKKDGAVIPNATNNFIAFTPAQYSNSGFYSVTVSNALGTTTASGQLNASYVPGNLDLFWNLTSSSAGTVTNLGVSPEGKLYVAGASGNKLYRFNTNGGVDNTFTATNLGNIGSFIVQADGKLLVAHGTNITRLNTNGNWDITWTNRGFAGGGSASAQRLAQLQNGQILAFGNFSGYGPFATPVLVRLNPDGSADTSYKPLPNALIPNPSIFAWTPDGTVFIGATSIQTVVHRFRPDGSRDASYAPSFSASVSHIEAALDGSLVAVGPFTSVNGLSRPGLARILPSGNLDNSFVPTAPINLLTIYQAVLQPNGKILLNGAFGSINNFSAAAGILRVNSDGSIDRSFNDIPGVSPIRAVALFPDGRIAIGGDFTTIHGVSRARVAVLQGDFTDPAFTTRPSGQFADAGSNVTLTSSVFSNGAVSYQWYYNGALLAGQTNSTLTLNGVTLAQAGNYTVIAISAAGTNSSTAQLTVIGAPVITQQPAAGEFWVGSTNSLSVVAIGTPTLNYQWSKNSQDLLNATNSILILTNAQTGDSGSYVVTVSNGAGSTSSIPVQVTVVSRGGSLITTWPPNGAVTSGNYTDVEALPDGKFLIAGNNIFGNAPYFSRLNSDGSMDGSFNAGLASGNGTGNLGKFVIAPSGQIYLQRSASIQRHSSNGALENDFTFRGISGTTVPTIADFALAPDGKLIVGGSFTNYGGVPVKHIVRLHQDGSIDGGFFPALTNTVTALTVQPDGKILLGLSLGSFSGSQLWRLNPDGSRDGTFSTNTLADNYSGSILEIVVLSDGRIYVGGGFTTFGGAPGIGIVRLFSNGERDFTFTTPTDTSAKDIAVQGNGRIVVAGVNTSKAFRRYNPDGSVDAKFHQDNGAVSTGAANAVAIDPQGRVLCAGQFNAWNVDNFNSYSRSGLALLNGDPIQLFIYQQAQPQVVNIGGAATFTVGVTSAAPVTLQWQKNGTNLVGQTAATLNISNAQTNDAGMYSVVVTSGGLSQTSNPVQLTVVGLPAITLQPANLEAYYTKTAILNVGVNGSWPITFQWRQNGTNIANGTNSVLYFTNLQFSAAGNYELVVSNSFGAVTSSIATLNVSILHGTRDFTFAPSPGPNNSIQQLVSLADGSFFILGNFSSYNGVSRPSIALVNSDGSLNTTFSNGIPPHSTPTTAVVQSDGKLVIGGTFAGLGSFTSPYLARFLKNGSIDTNFTVNLGTGPNQSVTRLAVQPDDKIVVGGGFTSFNGVTHTNLVRLNVDGTLDFTFRQTNVSFGINGLIVQPDSKIIVALGGSGRVVRLNNDGSNDSSWIEPSASVSLMAFALQPDGKILMGGSFTIVNGQTARYIVRLNSNGTLDSSFNSGTNLSGSVSSIVMQEDGKILIGGSFTSIQGEVRNYFARLNSDGSLDTTFQPGTGPSGSSPSNPLIHLQPDGRIILAGGFTSYDGSNVPYLVAINGQPNSFAITSHPIARTILLGENTSFSVGVMGAGPFSYQWYKNNSPLSGEVGSTLLRNNAQDSDSGLYKVVVTSGAETRTSRTVALTVLGAPIFASQPSSLVSTQGSSATFSATASGANPITYQWQKNGNVVPGATGSSFTLQGVGASDAGVYSVVASNVFGVATSQLAVLSVNLLPAGALDVSFGTNGPNSSVNTIALDPASGGTFIGGNFTFVDGQSRSYLAKLTAAGTLDTNFAATLNSPVQTLAVQPDGKLIVGGSFTTAGSTPRQSIARFNTNGSLDLTFSNLFGPSSTVYSVAVLPSGKILASGQFFTVDGVSRSYLARLNDNGSLDTTWGTNNMANDYIQSISVQSDGKILIGGGFTSVRGVARSGVARLNEDGTLDNSFQTGGPNFSSSVIVVKALSNGKVIVGGTFTGFSSTTRRYLVQLDSTGAVDTNFNANLNGSSVAAIAEQANGKLLIGGNYSLVHNGVTAYSFMRFLTNGVGDTNFVVGTSVNFGASIQSIALQPDNNIVIGGSFSSYSGTSKAYLARIFGEGAGAPTVSVTPSNVTATPGENIFLAGIATGQSSLRFQWQKEGVNIVGQTNTFLSLQNAQTNAAGNYTLVVSNSLGVVTSAAATVTFQAGSPFQSWASSFGLTAGNNGAGDDADGDGLANVFEYYFGTSPADSVSSDLPIATAVNSGGQSYPAITFIRVKNVVGVTLLPQASSDVNFSNSLGTILESAIDLGGGLEQVTIRSAISAAVQPMQFLRIQLSIP